MYPYEDLDPERFQKFCQSLVVAEHRHVQCFPVGQPDGGRDAISRPPMTTSFLTFQVKFVRNPFRDFDVKDWLRTTIKDELFKVANLLPKGASGYHFITNVPGSTHPDAGLIDSLTVRSRLGFAKRRQSAQRTLCWIAEYKNGFPESYSKALRGKGNQLSRNTFAKFIGCGS